MSGAGPAAGGPGPAAGVRADLEALLADPACGWSVGTWGASADLLTHASDPPVDAGPRSRAAADLRAAWPAGALRLDPPKGLRVLAWERSLRHFERWTHGVALCLPEGEARASGRTVVTELGPDADAIDPADRDAVLFDLGLGTIQVDVCVRTAHPACLAALRAAAGRPVWDPAATLLPRLPALSPARVLVTPLGRAEVTAPIPPPDGRTPPGAHTHVLPRILATGRTHPATEPLPPGLVPCATAFPPHPTLGPANRPLASPDAGRHPAFQALLRRRGDPAYVAAKDAALEDLRAGRDPGEPRDRTAARAVRVARRQVAALGAAAA